MILVTGATSWIGKEVVRQLVVSGKQVKVFHDSGADISPLQSFSDQIMFVQGDILDVTDVYEMVIGVESVFHCATINEWTSETYEYRMKVNVEGTANIVNAMLYHGIPKIIFFSSLITLGADPEKVSDENTKAEKNEWTTEQALSLLLAEREIWRGSVEGLDVAVINSADVVTQDLNGHHLMSAAVNALKSGKVDIYPSDIYYVSIEDLAKLALKVYQYPDWNKRWLAIGGVMSSLGFYQEVSKIYPSKWNARKMRQSSVFFKVLKDFFSSLFMRRNRMFRRVHGKRLLADLKFDGSHTTQVFDMKWQSLKEILSKK